MSWKKHTNLSTLRRGCADAVWARRRGGEAGVATVAEGATLKVGRGEAREYTVYRDPVSVWIERVAEGVEDDERESF